MHFSVRLALASAVVWQALAAAWHHAERCRAAAAMPWQPSLLATTSERVQAVLGPDAPIVEGLRDLAAGRVVLTRQVTGSIDELRAVAKDERELAAAFERLSARNGLQIQLTALLYPSPFVLRVPEPIALIEREAGAGRERWLLVIAGDVEPQAGGPWSCVHTHPRWSLWRYQKGS